MLVLNGNIIHHRNCTYCTLRTNVPKPIQKKKRSKGKLEMMEVCSLTGNEIPPPMSPGRVCDAYKQVGCECPT